MTRVPTTLPPLARPAGRRRRACLVLVALSLVVPSLASRSVAAHELRPAVADLARDGDALEIALRVNVEALIAGIGVAHEDTDDSPQAADYDALRALDPTALAGRLERFLPRLLEGLVLVDEGGRRLEPALAATELPEVGDVRVARDSTLRLVAPLPADATALTWRWSRDFGPVIVRSARADGPDAFSVYLLPGETSDPLPLGSAEGGEDGATARSGVPVGTFLNYVNVGFRHIVPLGIDHVLFVVGLFLLAPRARPIFWQVTTFTLAHSVTLALATFGIVSVPARIVEPLIALSIVVVALENLFTSRLHRWRLLVVFAFGLLHGLGFASVLADVGGGTGAFVTRLIAFNVGVELGQLLVVALCFAAVGWWFRDAPWYRRVVAVPGSLAIGAIGLLWFVQRAFGLG